MRRHHDMGGLPAGPVERGEHDHALWEKRVDAMQMLLAHPSRALITTDRMRKGIEALPPDAYDAMSYYERWVASITHAMVERGVITLEELERKMAEVAERQGDGSDD